MTPNAGFYGYLFAPFFCGNIFAQEFAPPKAPSPVFVGVFFPLSIRSFFSRRRNACPVVFRNLPPSFPIHFKREPNFLSHPFSCFPCSVGVFPLHPPFFRTSRPPASSGFEPDHCPLFFSSGVNNTSNFPSHFPLFKPFFRPPPAPNGA